MSLEAVQEIENLASIWQKKLAIDLSAYKNHVHRVYYLSTFLENRGAIDLRKLAILLFFHDLGLWTEGSLDYIEPSVKLAENYLEESGLATWNEEIASAIREHHKLTPFKGPHSKLIETVRKADLIDLSRGWISWGISRTAFRNIEKRFPSLGFRRFLFKRFLIQFLRNPLKPLPMLKW